MSLDEQRTDNAYFPDRRPAGPPYVGENGQMLTVSLFFETAVTNLTRNRTCTPIFTLEDEKPGFICARTTFIALKDPTGYKWAEQYLGSYVHYKRLLDCSWFSEAVTRWKAEVREALKSEALEKIREISMSTSPTALAAAKYLADAAYEGPKRGRPSAGEVKGELKRQAKEQSDQDEDWARMTAHLNETNTIKEVAN